MGPTGPERFVFARIQREIGQLANSRITQPNILERCGTGRRYPWADITDGWTTPYKGNPPIPTQTDGGNYDLDLVKSGTLNLATTINEVVLDSHCNPIIL